MDPGAIGLQFTSDGRPKVIDVVDCSGSGDVIMSKGMRVDTEGCLTGVGGKKLLVDPSWPCPSGEFRVGIKRIFEIYPEGLKGRVLEKRKKDWLLKTRLLEAQLQKDLAAAEGEDIKEDIKARIALLGVFEKEYDDPGPIYDCIVFHDGERWQAVIDTTETGDMRGLQPMANYAHARQFRRFSDVDALNFAVNIFDDGAILSIVVDAGAHGTHVAGIISAYHPDNPELNGVSPGTQIISLKIGNSRLGSMETATGLHRALVEAVRRGCHIINMSFGEAAAWADIGSFVKLAETIVKKHGVVFVGSAGNNGPALSTVGAPCGTSSCIMSIGAFVTKSLMNAAYSSLAPDKLQETNYTWSSMGPTLDGHRGVSVLAPGCAVTSVPNWTLARNQLMNGTSMAAPNACGCISLLLCAAKATGISFERLNPLVVRRVIQNSARVLPTVEVLGQGCGLLQVNNAWKLITDSRAMSDPWFDVTFDVKVNCGRFSRGIYLRHPVEANTATTFKIDISAVFFDRDNVSPDRLVQFEMRIRLESTSTWASCPSTLLMTSATKTITVAVDPRFLPLGKCHTCNIFGYDESFPEKGPVFEIPITVIRAVEIPKGQSSLQIDVPKALSPGQRFRKYLVPPSGCTFVDVVVTDQRPPYKTAAVLDSEGEFVVPDTVVYSNKKEEEADVNAPDSAQRTLALHAVQLVLGEPYRDHEKDSYLYLDPGAVKVMSFNVLSGVTMELVIASFWSTSEDCNVNVEIFFRGVHPSSSVVALCGGDRVSEIVQLRNDGSESVDISPTAKLDKWRQVIKPSSLGVISVLGERDIMLDGSSLYQMILSYDIDQTEAGDVIIRFPALQGILYESAFVGQFFCLYDASKRLVGVGDAWPKAIKTGKGKHTLQMQLRGASVALLEPLADMPAQVERKLKIAVTLSAFRSKCDATRGVAEDCKVWSIYAGGTITVFFKEPAFDQLPKNVSPGDFLIGTVKYISRSNGRVGANSEPEGFPLRYCIADTKPPSPSNGKSKSSGAESPTVTVETLDQSVLDALRDTKVKFLSDLPMTPSELFDKFAASVVGEYPRHLPLLHAILVRASKRSKQIKSDSSLEDSIRVFNDVLSAAKNVVSLIDMSELAMEFGVNVDKEDKVAMKRRKDLDTKKASLIDALVSSASALLSLKKVDVANSASHEAQLQAAVKELQRWDDINADKHWQFLLERNKADGKIGLVLKKVTELITTAHEGKQKNDSLSVGDLHEERNTCFALLGPGWAHISSHISAWSRFLKKDSYEPF